MGNVLFTSGSSEGSSEVSAGESQALVATVDKLLGESRRQDDAYAFLNAAA